MVSVVLFERRFPTVFNIKTTTITQSKNWINFWGNLINQILEWIRITIKKTKFSDSETASKTYISSKVFILPPQIMSKGITETNTRIWNTIVRLNITIRARWENFTIVSLILNFGKAKYSRISFIVFTKCLFSFHWFYPEKNDSIIVEIMVHFSNYFDYNRNNCHIFAQIRL